MGDCTYIVDIRNLTVHVNAGLDSGIDNMYYHANQYHANQLDDIEISGHIKSIINKKDKEMADYSKDECYNKSAEIKDYCNPKELAQKYVNLGLDDNQKLLRRHGVVNLDGTITSKGTELLLNMLFEEYEDKIVAALVDIEVADEEE